MTEENESVSVIAVIDSQLDCIKKMKEAVDQSIAILQNESKNRERKDSNKVGSAGIIKNPPIINFSNSSDSSKGKYMENNSIREERSKNPIISLSEEPLGEQEEDQEQMTDDFYENYKHFLAGSQKSIASSSNPFHKYHWFYSVSQEGIQDTFYYPYVLHPRSNGVQLWNAVCNFSTVCFLALLPMFATVPQYKTYETVLSLIIMTVGIVTIIINLNTATFISDAMVTNRKRILLYNLSSGKLFIELVGAFPWVLIGKGNNYMCLLNGLCIVRLFQSKETHILMSVTKLKLKYKIDNTLVIALRVLFLQLLYWHWAVAVKWILWSDNLNTHLLSNYSITFYLICHKQLSIGNDWGSARMYAVIFNHIVTTLFQIIFVTLVATFMVELDRCGKVFANKTEEVNNFSNLKGFRAKFKSHLYISVTESQSLILKVPFFRDADEQFIAELAMRLESETFLEEDIICEEGEWGDKMFFIVAGKVEVISPNTKRHLLSVGAYFGESALLNGPVKRKLTAKAYTQCSLLSISKSVFDAVLSDAPVMKRKIQKIAAAKLAADKKYYEDQKRREAHLNASTKGFGGPAINDDSDINISGYSNITSSLSPWNPTKLQKSNVLSSVMITNSLSSTPKGMELINQPPVTHTPVLLPNISEGGLALPEGQSKLVRNQSFVVYEDTKPISFKDNKKILASGRDEIESDSKDLHNLNESNLNRMDGKSHLSIPVMTVSETPLPANTDGMFERANSVFSYIKYEGSATGINLELSMSILSKASNNDSSPKLLTEPANKQSTPLLLDINGSKKPAGRYRSQTIIQYGADSSAPNIHIEAFDRPVEKKDD